MNEIGTIEWLWDSMQWTDGLDITITTSAPTDAEAFELLLGLGMPFAKEGRPVADGDAEATDQEEQEG